MASALGRSATSSWNGRPLRHVSCAAGHSWFGNPSLHLQRRIPPCSRFMVVPRFPRIDGTNEEAGLGSDRCKWGNFDALVLYCRARILRLVSSELGVRRRNSHRFDRDDVLEPCRQSENRQRIDVKERTGGAQRTSGIQSGSCGPGAAPLALGLLTFMLVWLIKLYQWTLSPLLGACCRFEPSCSRYTLTCIERWGPLRGSWLGLRRVSRCHPFCPGGHDPPPELSS
jgi:putative membrane protein insertion efficiency factor